MSDNDEKILNEELNTDELKTATGGHKCSKQLYDDSCDATVENTYSWCMSHDACIWFSITYTVKN